MEQQKDFVNTGISISRDQFKKLREMAIDLNTSHSKLVGMLIEAAEIIERPKVAVQLEEKVIA